MKPIIFGGEHVSPWEDNGWKKIRRASIFSIARRGRDIRLRQSNRNVCRLTDRQYSKNNSGYFPSQKAKVQNINLYNLYTWSYQITLLDISFRYDSYNHYADGCNWLLLRNHATQGRHFLLLCVLPSFLMNLLLLAIYSLFHLPANNSGRSRVAQAPREHTSRFTCWPNVISYKRWSSTGEPKKTTRGSCLAWPSGSSLLHTVHFDRIKQFEEENGLAQSLL